MTSNTSESLRSAPSQLLALLASGVPAANAAMALGLTELEVATALADPEFSAALAAERGEKLEAAIAHDGKIESVEEKALKVLEQKLPFVRNPLEAARIFQILNSSRKRTATDSGANQQSLGAQSVNIVLPKAAQVLISMNSLNQVIEVQGRSMATLPSRNLPGLLTDLKDQQRATAVLDRVEPMKTVINGVERVL